MSVHGISWNRRLPRGKAAYDSRADFSRPLGRVYGFTAEFPFTVEVIEPMTSDAILNSLSRLAMPWRFRIHSKSV